MLKWSCLGLLSLFGVNAVVLFSQPEASGRLEALYESVTNVRKRGFVHREFTDDDGKKHKYAVFVPFSFEPSQKLPILISLNGRGKRGYDGVSQLKDGAGPAIWEMKRTFPYIAFFPQTPPTTEWAVDDDLVALTVQMLDAVIEEYGADPDRVYLTGISSGGAGVWKFVELFPDRFAAIVPISTPGCEPTSEEVVIEHRIPVWSFYVRGDAESLVQFNRDQYRRFLDAGQSPLYTEIKGDMPGTSDQHNGWDFAFRDVALYQWLSKCHLQDGRRDQTPFKQILFTESDFDNNWKTDDASWSIDSTGVLTARAPNDASGAPLVFRGSVQNCDLHLEFKTDAGAACCVQFGDPSHATSGIAVVVCSADASRGGIYSLDGSRPRQSPQFVAQHAFVPGEWNDLRIRRDGDFVEVLLNGWTLHQYHASDFHVPDGPIALSIRETTESGDEAVVRWRHVRMCPI